MGHRRTLPTTVYTPRDVQNPKRLILESQKSQKEIGRSIGTYSLAIKVSDCVKIIIILLKINLAFITKNLLLQLNLCI